MRAIDVIFSMCKSRGFAVTVDDKLAFDLIDRTIHLTDDVFNSCSSRSLTIVAHECGHALQPHKILLLSWCLANAGLIVPVVVFFALGLHTAMLALIIQVLVNRLIILSIELDASRRAYRWLQQSKQVNLKIAKRVLTEGVLTYLKLF